MFGPLLTVTGCHFPEGGLTNSVQLDDGASVAFAETDNSVEIHAYLQPTKVPNEYVFFAHSRDPNSKIVAYHWDLGDNTTSSLPMVRKVYDDLGTYSVMLAATVNDGNKRLKTVAHHTVEATTMAWRPSEYQLELGENWRTNNNAPLCRGHNLDCGPATVTIRNAPNGVYDLQMMLLHQATRSGAEPGPRFLLDGQLVDFTPLTKPKPAWSFETVKTVTITDNQLRFVVDDLEDASVSFSRIALRSIGERLNDQVHIVAQRVRGEVPLPVAFSIDSSLRMRRVFWDFGDGNNTDQMYPRHTFLSMGRHIVKLAYITEDGTSGVATTVITVKPSKVNLPGLKDIKYFGFWSSGLKSVDAHEFNQRRFTRLRNMRATHVWPSGVSSHLPADIATGINFGAKGLWFRNDEKGQPLRKWIFDPAQARSAVRATISDGTNTSAFDDQDDIDWVYMGHEIAEYTTHAQRVKMYNTLKRFFPNTPVMAYYGNISIGFERGYKDRFGPGEADIVSVGVRNPFVFDETGERRFDPRRAMNAVLRNKKYVVEHAPGTTFWALKNLPGEKLGSDPKDREKAVKEMWSAEELLDYARVLLSIGDIEAMIFRAYGRWTYDLSFGDNDEHPQEPETGFIEQRLAMRTIGGWIHQARHGRPILMIRSPEIGETLEGNRVTIHYAIIHGNASSQTAVFTLDGRTRIDADRNGKLVFANVYPGSHRLTAHIENNGEKIEESDIEILFATQ